LKEPGKRPAHWTQTPVKNLCVDKRRVKPQRNGPNQSVKEKMKKREEETGKES
jgi:hypothetical protein